MVLKVDDVANTVAKGTSDDTERIHAVVQHFLSSLAKSLKEGEEVPLNGLYFDKKTTRIYFLGKKNGGLCLYSRIRTRKNGVRA